MDEKSPPLSPTQLLKARLIVSKAERAKKAAAKDKKPSKKGQKKVTDENIPLEGAKPKNSNVE